MRIAITGATGNVGTALLRRLADEPDIEVLGIARRIPSPDVGPPYDRAEWHSLDLGEPASLDAMIEWFNGIDAVIHLAWQVQPSHLRKQLRRSNLNGTRRVVEAVQRAGIPSFLYASSVGVYAPAPEGRFVDENWPATGVAYSGHSVDKSAVEGVLDTVERENPKLRVVRMRTAMVFQYVAGAEFARYFLPRLSRGRLRTTGRLTTIPTNRRLRIQVVHAEDVAEAFFLALRSDVRGAFNLAAEPVLNVPLVAQEAHSRTVSLPIRLLRSLTHFAWRAHLQPAEPGWLDLLESLPLMDSGKAKRELGWQPRHDARETLRDLINGIADGAGTASPPMLPSSGPKWWPSARLPAAPERTP